MFKKQIQISLAILTPILGFWLIQMTMMRQSDISQYVGWVQKRKIAASQKPSSTRQHRKEVRKDIWFSQDDCQRFHYHIESEGSLLTLTPIHNKFEIVESLQGIKCWMQEKLYNQGDPMQQTRYFEASEGDYRYTTKEFLASDVTLSFFRLPGHQLPKQSVDPKEAFLQGQAKDISFFFGGNTPQFQARQFQATMVKDDDAV